MDHSALGEGLSRVGDGHDLQVVDAGKVVGVAGIQR